MPKPATLSPEAFAYLRREHDYLLQRSPAAAKRFLDLIEKARSDLADFPRLGPPTPIPGVRRYIAAPYILTYRVEASRILIFAIRHGRQAESN